MQIKKYKIIIGVIKKVHYRHYNMADQQKFIIEALNKHNEFRKRHGVNELVHNQDLSKQALAWASILAEKNQIVYSNTETAKERFGENIAMVYSYDTYDGL